MCTGFLSLQECVCARACACVCACVCMCFLACLCMGFLFAGVCVRDGTMREHVTDYKLIEFQLFNHE